MVMIQETTYLKNRCNIILFLVTVFSTTLSNFQKCFLFENAFYFLKETIISQIFLYFEGMELFLKSVVGRDTQV